jgi:HPt (histidine-containing phosphotransfer) domain-containing protein
MPQFTDFLKAADLALYAAKRAGRHTIRAAESTDQRKATVEATARKAEQAAVVEPSAPKKPAEPPIDLQAVLKRCGGDAKFAGAVTERFRAHASGEVEKITQALTSGDGDALSRFAHSLKSMSAYMAADSASNLAKRIEELGRERRLTEVSPLLNDLRQEIDYISNWITQNAAAEKLQPVNS